MSVPQIRAAAERERRRRLPAVVDSDGQAYHHGREVSLEYVEELPAGDSPRAIDFRPPGEDQI